MTVSTELFTRVVYRLSRRKQSLKRSLGAGGPLPIRKTPLYAQSMNSDWGLRIAALAIQLTGHKTDLHSPLRTPVGNRVNYRAKGHNAGLCSRALRFTI